MEGVPNVGNSRVAQRAIRQGHRDVVHLPDEAHVGKAFDTDAGRVDIGCAQLRAALGLELCEQRIEASRIEAVFERDDP